MQLAGYLPGEADEIRKAVGKKIKEKIEAHKAKFIAGSVKNGIEQSVAEAIYGDIEFFARYGFNKAHAADYAVMTCQTAYLKAHYPVEYMTALMTVEQSIEKIGLLIIETPAHGHRRAAAQRELQRSRLHDRSAAQRQTRDPLWHGVDQGRGRRPGARDP